MVRIPPTSGGKDELLPNTADLRADRHLIMWGTVIHKNIPVFDTKLTTCLRVRVRFVSSYLAADKHFPVNPREITGPPNISLVFVAYTDNQGWYITSNQRGQTFVQNLNRIISKPNVAPWKILYCTPNCMPINLMFQGNFLLTHKF